MERVGNPKKGGTYRVAAINYDAIPETARQDFLAVIVKIGAEHLKDPEVQARYKIWKEKREAAKAAAERR